MKPVFHFTTGERLVKLIHFPTVKPLAAVGQAFSVTMIATPEMRDCLLDLKASPPDGVDMVHFFQFIVLRGNRITLIVTEWMLTDGVSIPRFMWRVVGSPFEGIRLPSALSHDLLCYLSKMLPSGAHRRAVRRFGDDMMPQFMAVMGEGVVAQQTVHKGVRFGGWSSRNAPRIDAVPMWDGKEKRRTV